MLYQCCYFKSSFWNPSSVNNPILYAQGEPKLSEFTWKMSIFFGSPFIANITAATWAQTEVLSQGLVDATSRHLGHCWTCLHPLWTHLYFLSIISCGLDFPRIIYSSCVLQKFAFHRYLSPNVSVHMSLWSIRAGRKGQGYYLMSNCLLLEL